MPSIKAHKAMRPTINRFMPFVGCCFTRPSHLRYPTVWVVISRAQSSQASRSSNNWVIRSRVSWLGHMTQWWRSWQKINSGEYFGHSASFKLKPLLNQLLIVIDESKICTDLWSFYNLRMKPVFEKHSLMSITNEESQKKATPFMNLITYH